MHIVKELLTGHKYIHVFVTKHNRLSVDSESLVPPMYIILFAGIVGKHLLDKKCIYSIYLNIFCQTVRNCMLKPFIHTLTLKVYLRN